MSEFEAYSNELLASSKRFLNEAKTSGSDKEKQRNLRASLTHAFFFLEAQLNYLASHFSSSLEFSVIERSLLSELDVSLSKGTFVITDKPKFYRLEERIEFLLARFSSDVEVAKGSWFAELKSSIRVRNRLVHPKDAHVLKFDEVENSILAVLSCLSALYGAIFGKPFPPSALGLDLGPDS